MCAHAARASRRAPSSETSDGARRTDSKAPAASTMCAPDSAPPPPADPVADDPDPLAHEWDDLPPFVPDPRFALAAADGASPDRPLVLGGPMPDLTAVLCH